MAQLKRDLNTSGILLASVSAIIGSGWLFGSLYAAQMAGPIAIFSWFIGGISVALVAFCFAELATLFPQAGGMGTFAHATHGRGSSFIVSWVSWLAFVIISPIEVQAVIQYMGNYVDNLTTTIDAAQHLTAKGFAVAVALLACLAAVNAVSVKFLSKTNTLFTIWKLLIPITIVRLFLFAAHPVANLTSQGGFAPYGLHGVFASLSVSGIVLAFNGFQPGIALAGETRNPQRNIPIAILGSLAICMVIYCALQFAFILAVPPALLQNGWSHLNFEGVAGPLAGLSHILGFHWAANMLYIDALISPLACALIFFAAASRTSYAMSQEKFLPRFFGRLNHKGVPFSGIVVTFFISIFVFLIFHGWQELASFYAAAICFCNAFVPLSLFRIRKSQVYSEHSFRVPMYKIFSLAAFYISNLMFFLVRLGNHFQARYCHCHRRFVLCRYEFFQQRRVHSHF